MELRHADLRLKVGHLKEAGELYRKMAEVFLEKDMKKEAIEAFRKLKVLSTPDIDQLMALGDLLCDQGDLDGAEEEYRSALKLDINNLIALSGLAEVCLKKGGYRDAIIAYNKILTLNPGDITIKEKLCDMHISRVINRRQSRSAWKWPSTIIQIIVPKKP